ncbi:MAG: ribosomal protein L7/L12, partial [Mycobacteriales bacterium]
VSGRWLLGVSVAAIGVGGVLRRWPGSVAGEDARSTGGASSVVLVAVKPKKIPVIRVIRAETALGLKESKRLTDRGGVVAYGLSSGDADRLVGLLTDAGATARRVDLPPG